jgi:hypothetical protein
MHWLVTSRRCRSSAQRLASVLWMEEADFINAPDEAEWDAVFNAGKPGRAQAGRQLTGQQDPFLAVLPSSIARPGMVDSLPLGDAGRATRRKARSAFGSAGSRLCWKMRILDSANRPGQCWSPRLARRRSAIGNLLAAGLQPGVRASRLPRPRLRWRVSVAGLDRYPDWREPMPDQNSSARYIFRAITLIRPARKSSVLRDIRRVIAPYLEPGESIETCAMLYSGALAMGYGLVGAIRAIQRNRTVRVYYAAVTSQRVLIVEVSWYVQRPKALALSDARQGASLRPLTNPATSRNVYAAVEYRSPSGQARKLWYNGQFTDEVGRHLLGLGPEQEVARQPLSPRDRRALLLIAAFTLAVVLAAVLAGLLTS